MHQFPTMVFLIEYFFPYKVLAIYPMTNILKSLSYSMQFSNFFLWGMPCFAVCMQAMLRARHFYLPQAPSIILAALIVYRFLKCLQVSFALLLLFFIQPFIISLQPGVHPIGICEGVQ